MDQKTRDRLEDERERLMHEYGWGPAQDGKVRDRIAEIDKKLAKSI
ncbi:hypothetical protein [Tritonibacter mobilis]